MLTGGRRVLFVCLLAVLVAVGASFSFGQANLDGGQPAAGPAVETPWGQYSERNPPASATPETAHSELDKYARPAGYVLLAAISAVLLAFLVRRFAARRNADSPTATELLFGREGTHNRVYRANLSGGLIGWNKLFYNRTIIF